VLDDLPVLVETEDVDACSILVLVSWPFLMAVQDDVIAFREGAFEMNALARVFLRHFLRSRQ